MSLTGKIVDRVKNFILKNKLIENKDNVLIALSGGSDSTSLFRILNSLKQSLKINKIGIAHYNHNVRGDEAKRDETFCRNLASDFDIEFYCGELSEKMPSGISSQEFYREKRYDYLKRICKIHGYNKIATGHTLDDVSENVIMRLFSGTGTAGISGISVNNDSIIRPIIFLSRQELEIYLKGLNQKFVFDSSNHSEKYLRNSVRINLLPVIDEIFPSYKNAVYRFTEIAGIENDYFNKKIQKIYNKLNINQGEIRISGEQIKKLHPAILSRLFIYIASQNSAALSHTHIKSINDSTVKKNHGTKEILNINGLKIINEYGDIIFKTPPKHEQLLLEPFEFMPDMEFNYCGYSVKCKKINEVNIPGKEKNFDLYFDNDKIEFPLKIRTYKSGDRIKLFEDKKAKKIKELLIDYKIPKTLRKNVVIIEDNNKIIAVLPPAASKIFFKRTNIQTYITENIKNTIRIKINKI